METLLRIGLSNAVATVLLALIVVTAACVWRRPALLHALWLLVLVKLLTPPLLWLPEPWAPAESAAKAGAETPAVPAPADPPPIIDAKPAEASAVLVDAPAALDLAFIADPQTEPEPPAVAPTPSPARAATAPWQLTAVFGAWLAGSLAWYALALVRLWRFGRLLRHAAPAPESLRRRTQRLSEKLGLRRCPGVWLVPGRVAPMLWAVGGRPRILFPSELLGLVDVEQQNALLVHELAHLRRRDHWVRWLEFAAAGLYWWHPVLWFARRELREAEEQCCDAWVTSTLPGAGKTYATALLETLAFLSDAPPVAPLLASGVGRVADLKRRLTMIMRGTTPRGLGWRGCAAVLGLGVLLLPLLPAWAQAQVQIRLEEKEEPAPAKAGAAADADLDKVKAELKELEAQLAQKEAETAAIAARVQLLRARVNLDAGPEKGRFFVRFGASGTDPESLRDLAKRLQAAQAGASTPQVIVIDGTTGKIIMKMEEANRPPNLTPAPGWVVRTAPPGAPMPPPLGNPVVPPQGGFIFVPPAGVPGASPADGDKRIDELEMKLKSILEEVEKLRHERKPAAPEGGAGAPAGSPPPVVTKVPYLDRLFINVNTEAAQEQNLKALQATSAAQAAQRAALSAQLEDLKAKAADVAHRRDLEVVQAKAELDKAEATLQLAEKTLTDARNLAKSGAVSQGDLDKALAEAAVQRANVQKAQAQVEQVGLDHQARLRDLDKQTAAAAAALKDCEENLQKVQQEVTKLKSPQPDDPKKP